MKLVISIRAREDLCTLEEYIGTDNPQAGPVCVLLSPRRRKFGKWLASLYDPLDKINGGYRSVTHGQYVIFYFVDGENVVLARVIHGNRDIRRALQED